MIFAKDLQNQFTLKLICDLISQPISKFCYLIEGYFMAIPIRYDRYLYYLVFILQILNFNTCNVFFYSRTKKW